MSADSDRLVDKCSLLVFVTYPSCSLAPDSCAEISDQAQRDRDSPLYILDEDALARVTRLYIVTAERWLTNKTPSQRRT